MHDSDRLDCTIDVEYDDGDLRCGLTIVEGMLYFVEGMSSYSHTLPSREEGSEHKVKKCNWSN